MDMADTMDSEVLLEIGSGPTLEELEAEEKLLEEEDAGEEASGDEISGGAAAPMYQLRLEYAAETLFAPTPPRGAEYKAGDSVIVPTKFGRDIARVSGVAKYPGGLCRNNEVTIERLATEAELSAFAQLAVREQEAAKVFQKKAEDRGLEMKLVSVHFLFDESKVIFFFSADSRVDFRDLVVDLSSVFRMRIELRQISVRDEARLCGALGLCGRTVCCRAVSDRLKPVSIRMAKEQNLSLNSMKISGQCGRLLCCLGFENAWYGEARKMMPPEGTDFFYDGTDFRVSGCNLITQTVQMRGVDGRILEIPAPRFSRQGSRWVISE